MAVLRWMKLILDLLEE